MYIETSRPRRQGQKARLASASITQTGSACVSFYYHMYGRNMGSLNIYVKEQTLSGTSNLGQPVWRRQGNQQNRWIMGQFTIMPSQSFQVRKLTSWRVWHLKLSRLVKKWRLEILKNACAQPLKSFTGVVLCLELPLVPYIVWANSIGSGKTARIHRLAWVFAGRLCDKYHFHMSRLKLLLLLLFCYDFEKAEFQWLKSGLQYNPLVSCSCHAYLCHSRYCSISELQHRVFRSF